MLREGVTLTGVGCGIQGAPIAESDPLSCVLHVSCGIFGMLHAGTRMDLPGIWDLLFCLHLEQQKVQENSHLQISHPCYLHPLRASLPLPCAANAKF